MTGGQPEIYKKENHSFYGKVEEKRKNIEAVKIGLLSIKKPARQRTSQPNKIRIHQDPYQPISRATEQSFGLRNWHGSRKNRNRGFRRLLTGSLPQNILFCSV